MLTGEHGVGVEKRDLMPEMFSEIDLNQQQRLKCAFDAQGLLNPGKVFPTLHRCAELGRVHVHGGKLAFPEFRGSRRTDRARRTQTRRIQAVDSTQVPYARNRGIQATRYAGYSNAYCARSRLASSGQRCTEM